MYPILLPRLSSDKPFLPDLIADNGCIDLQDISRLFDTEDRRV
jgi:hypothetical protein